MEQNHRAPTVSKTILDNTIPEESNMDTVGISKDGLGKDLEPPGSLVNTYYLTDKGKSMVVSPSDVDDAAKERVWMERELRDPLTCWNADIEGPSTRGFESFPSSPVKKS
ncbi:hypothetical protein PVL29_026012 [Vitis rotundifolia]|uniref:Uncharacterized protein n=1 Tax=Vitis rotundifolia TaxID=103349 RepID=A0AA38YLE4_VITRO|nr:hypothetical protein PVL29_026012 [Vitis rotundifolia]